MFKDWYAKSKEFKLNNYIENHVIGKHQIMKNDMKSDEVMVIDSTKLGLFEMPVKVELINDLGSLFLTRIA